MAIAGKVAITLSTENGGAWSADVTYDRLVAVKHNNNLYISRKTVANVEPPNDEFWFLALEGFSGDDIEKIISGETVVGNANLLEGFTAKQVGASGARNLIPYPYEKTTSTYSGITWTDNGDGTFTANGNTGSTSLFNSKPFVLEAGTYRLSGSPLMHSTGSSINGGITLRYADTGNGIGNYDVGFGSTITLTQKTTVLIRLVVQSVFGEANNLTFRPMLELGSVTHDFVPYHFGGAEKAKEAYNAKTLDGHGAEYFATLTDLSNYLPLTGGRVGDGASSVPLTIDGGTSMAFVEFGDVSKNRFGGLGFTGADIPAFIKADRSAAISLLHTGNKPTGTYTGNGSSESRMINIGGIGKVLHVYSSTSGTSAIVTPYGAIVITSTGEVIGFRPSQVRFLDGYLYTYTDNSAFNQSGVTYGHDLL